MTKKIIKYVLLAFLLFCLIMAFIGCDSPCDQILRQRSSQVYDRDYQKLEQTDSLVVKLCDCKK
jgi:hypothetical protein